MFDGLRRLRTHVADELFHHESPAADAPLALQWLGTAGFRVVGAGHHIWLDPHLSRHSLAEVAFGRIAPRPEAIARDVDICHAVMVGHSHFDHAIDTPWIAREHGARVYGAEDTLNCCRGFGVDEDQLVLLEPGRPFTEGPFALRGYRSQHSAFAFGRVPAPGRIEAPLQTPARAWDWRVGEVLGLHLDHPLASIYHVGSADLIEAEIEGVRADVVLCCTIGRHATERFTERVIDALQPRLLIPCHWDQFWRPLDAPPRQIPSNDLEGFLDEVRRHPRAPEVRVLPPRGWTRLSA